MDKELLTQYGYEKLTEEIKYLKEIERPKTIQELQTAREHGDLKENAEYHAAREKLQIIDSKLDKLSQLLANSRIIDPSTLDHSKVVFGSTVTIVDIDTDEEMTYTIAGSYEARPEKNIISYHSPLAQSLLGKSEGDEVEANLPGGVKEFEILKIEYKGIEFGD